LDFRAISFQPFNALPSRVKALLTEFFAAGPETPADTWGRLTQTDDDRAAALLAVTNALAHVRADLGGTSVPATDMMRQIQLLAGDRLYAWLDKDLIARWRSAGGKFRIALANGEEETGRVRFNMGGFGGSLHPGFDIQGFTSNTKIPRIQWNYRFCDGLGDVDIDGFSPFNPFQHFTFANSDPRQWYDRYTAKFGNAGFEVDRVGGVPERPVTNTSQCPAPEDRLLPEEEAAAARLGVEFAANLSATRDLSAVEARLFVEDFPTRVLKDEQASPLAGTVAESVIRSAPTDTLEDYYLARIESDLLSVSTLESARELNEAIDSRREAEIETVEELESERDRLRESVSLERATEPRAGLSSAQEWSVERVWLVHPDQKIFGLPAGERLFVVDVGPVQIIAAREHGRYRIVSAVPRSTVQR
jgi:hypothetical protein